MKENPFIDNMCRQLKTRREALKIRQRDLADQLGISRATYMRYENEGANIPIGLLFEISERLNIPMNELLPLSTAKPKKIEDDLVRKTINQILLMPDEHFRKKLCKMIINFSKDEQGEKADEQALEYDYF